jgi:hypothetical protein
VHVLVKVVCVRMTMHGMNSIKVEFLDNVRDCCLVKDELHSNSPVQVQTG